MALSGLKSSLWQDVKSLHAQKSKLPLHVLAAEMAVSSPPRPLPFFLLLTLQNVGYNDKKLPATEVDDEVAALTVCAPLKGIPLQERTKIRLF